MSMQVDNLTGRTRITVMADFVPLESLWVGTNPTYPSEFSARWELRKLRDQLAKAQAVAIHRGRLYIHPQRFAQVVEQVAISKFCGPNGLIQQD